MSQAKYKNPTTGEWTKLGVSISGLTQLSTLLWTNPSPTSEFASQTISLNMSGYNFALVVFRESSTDATLSSLMCIKDSTSISQCCNVVHAGSTKYMMFRGAKPSNDGVWFDGGYKAQGTSETLDNTLLIPYQIYGIKTDVGSAKVYSSNRNLLDNPWFTINQRGATSGTITTSDTYYLDRWKSSYANISGNFVISNGVQFSSASSANRGYLIQPFDGLELQGKTVTFSILLGDGSIVSATVVRDSSTTQLVMDTNDFLVYFNAGAMQIGVNNSALTIRAVKLEIGSISTLHLDVAPNYADELAKCQRYYFKKYISYNNEMFSVFSTSATDISFVVYHPIPCTMRGTPTVTLSPSLSATNGWLLTQSGPSFKSGTLSVKSASTGQVTFKITSSGLTAYALYGAAANSSSGALYYEVSADL